MKKRKIQEKKEGSFSVKPFNALKGYQSGEKTADTVAKVKPTSLPSSTDEDDGALFLRAVGDVKRLEYPGPPGVAGKKEAPPALRQETEDRSVFLKEIEKLKIDVRFQDELPPGVKPLKTSGSNRLRDLKKGVVRIGLELDLHGLTRAEALTSLERFVSGAYNRSQNAVLVITGKGNNSSDEPVLQMAVQGWLREKGKSMVAEFAPAPRQMGGSGAFVVFLKDKGKKED
jgi:DNA-nicking Smr family endonuclease